MVSRLKIALDRKYRKLYYIVEYRIGVWMCCGCVMRYGDSNCLLVQYEYSNRSVQWNLHQNNGERVWSLIFQCWRLEYGVLSFALLPTRVLEYVLEYSSTVLRVLEYWVLYSSLELYSLLSAATSIPILIVYPVFRYTLLEYTRSSVHGCVRCCSSDKSWYNKLHSSFSGLDFRHR
jgi:hypothetical protein